MIPLVLALAFAAAPIPKGDNYEGSIVLLLAKPDAEALILSPTGEELKRISLSEIDGSIEAIRLGRDRSCLLVEVHHEKPDSKNQFQQSLYWVDVATKSKPKKLITKDSRFTWMVNRETTTIFGSESIATKNLSSDEFGPQTHWKYDVKTGKEEKVDLPKEYSFIDIAHADNSILAAVAPPRKAPGEIRFVILSTKDWKVTFQSPDGFVPRLLSSDGKTVICDELNLKNNAIKQIKGMTIYNVKTKERSEFPISPMNGAVVAYTIGTNNRVVSVDAGINQVNNTKDSQEVHVFSYDGKSKTKIYSNKTGEQILDCDWR
ncbi:MAG: hypothetical protein U0798_03065 [Gemmataceae bacterium]